MKFNRIFVLLIILFPLFVLSQSIDIDYSKINTIQSDEDFTIIAIIKKGLDAIDNIYLKTVTLDNSVSKQFLMNIDKNIAEITVEHKDLPENDFYYYFEIVLQNREIILFPKNAKQRLNNVVKIIKKKDNKKHIILLSPDNREQADNDFIIALYINKDIKKPNIILNEKNITRKMKKGEELFTYIPNKKEIKNINKLSVYDNKLLIKEYIIVVKDKFVPYFINGNIKADYKRTFIKETTFFRNLNLLNNYNLSGNIYSYSEHLFLNLRFNLIGSAMPKLLNIFINANTGKIFFGIGDFTLNRDYIALNSYNIRGFLIDYNNKYFNSYLFSGMFYNDIFYNYLSYSENYTGGLFINTKWEYFNLNYAFLLNIENIDSMYFNNTVNGIKAEMNLIKLYGIKLALSTAIGIKGNEKTNISEVFKYNEMHLDSTLYFLSYIADIVYYKDNGSISIAYKHIPMSFNNSLNKEYVYASDMLFSKINLQLFEEKLNLLIKYDYSFDNNVNQCNYGFFLHYTDIGIPIINISFTHKIISDTIFNSLYFRNILSFKSNIAGTLYMSNIPVNWDFFIMQKTLNMQSDSLSLNTLIYGGDIIIDWNRIIKTQFTSSLLNYNAYAYTNNNYSLKTKIFLFDRVSFIGTVFGFEYILLDETNKKYNLSIDIPFNYNKIKIVLYLRNTIFDYNNNYYNRLISGININYKI